MRRRLNLRYFDGYGDMGDDDFRKAMDGIRYADFNEEETPPVAAPAPAPVPDDEDKSDVTEPPVLEEPPAAEPDAHADEPQPTAPAQPPQGVPAQLAEKYAPIIGALENDPLFRQAMADAIAARRGGGQVPAAVPQPEQQRPPEEDKEPVCGEDELLEDFEKRHAEWEKRQQDGRMRDQVNQALSERQAAIQREQFFRHAQDVNSLLQQDTEAPAVAGFMKQNPAPPRLMQLMNEDPDTFMYIYDGMRQLTGKGNYFAEVFAKRRGGGQAVQPVAPTPMPAGGAPGAPVPVGRTHVKGAAPVPFTESGGGNNGKGGSGPNFADMSDKEFALYTERVKMQGL